MLAKSLTCLLLLSVCVLAHPLTNSEQRDDANLEEISIESTISPEAQAAANASAHHVHHHTTRAKDTIQSLQLDLELAGRNVRNANTKLNTKSKALSDQTSLRMANDPRYSSSKAKAAEKAFNSACRDFEKAKKKYDSALTKVRKFKPNTSSSISGMGGSCSIQ